MLKILNLTFVKNQIRLYWPLIKSMQTGLLLATGLAGYLSSHAAPSIPVLLAVAGSLFLAISGSTILNMWYDRDIDTVMNRTHNRPLASGKIDPKSALRLGVVLAVLGVGWALALSFLYGLIVFLGLFFDVLVYTVWLKRKTCWSIVWGGISGGMPILAGRAMATGQVDLIGILLTLAVLFWIPTHMLTFSMRYFDDYQLANVPTFPARYGFKTTRAAIALSSVVAAACIGAASVMVGMQAGLLSLMAVLSAGLLLLSLATLFRPSDRVNFGLFKYASVYMLSAMILLAV